MNIKLLTCSIIAIFGLSGCNFGDTLVKRGGDNTGFKDWSVEQTIKWGKDE
jgi:hypothetical protein